MTVCMVRQGTRSCLNALRSSVTACPKATSSYWMGTCALFIWLAWWSTAVSHPPFLCSSCRLPVSSPKQMPTKLRSDTVLAVFCSCAGLLCFRSWPQCVCWQPMHIFCNMLSHDFAGLGKNCTTCWHTAHAWQIVLLTHHACWYADGQFRERLNQRQYFFEKGNLTEWKRTLHPLKFVFFCYMADVKAVYGTRASYVVEDHV